MMESVREELTRGDKEIAQTNFYWLYTNNNNNVYAHTNKPISWN